MTTAEFNGLSSAAYRNGIVHSERKILAKIHLGVICAHMVDFCRPGHILHQPICRIYLLQCGIINFISLKVPYK